MEEKITKLLIESLNNLKLNQQDKIEILIPKNTDNGDYSSNIALKLAKEMQKNPNEIANEIIASFPKHDFINKVENKNGFLNFYVDNYYLYDNLNKIIELGLNYGKNIINESRKINLEFVSANPTGILHMGHARAAFYGSSLSKIMRHCGYDVACEYYINDAGNQINVLANSVYLRYQELCGEKLVLPENMYLGNEIIEIAKEMQTKYNDQYVLEYDNIFRTYALNYLTDAIKDIMRKAKVEFDIFSSETSLYSSGKVEEVLKRLVEANATYEQEGAIYLKTSKYNDEKDRVIVKQDKTYTYLLPDIAYHIDKIERGYDNLIDVLGADHHGYVPRLKASLEFLGYDSKKLDVKILQMVKITKDGEEIKMSKRRGNAISIDDAIELLGLNAARYFFVSKSLDTKMNIDVDVVTKQSNENPFYYIEYAYARISSILKNSGNFSIVKEYHTIENETVTIILKELYNFKTMLLNSAKKLEVHTLTNYLYNLASLFHRYYNEEKIISTNEAYTNERLSLLVGIKNILQISLDLLGITPREHM